MLSGIEKNMIRVGFVLHLDKKWLGGVNYYRNLLSAIMDNPNRAIEPVVFVENTLDKNLIKDFPKVEIVQTNLFSRKSILGLMDKIFSEIFHFNCILNYFFYKNKIDVLSHLNIKFYYVHIPTIAWIPDFQHVYLPNLFSKKEINYRNNLIKKFSINCDVIIVSSNDAKKDLLKFEPESKGKEMVLHFVAKSNTDIKKITLNCLIAKYNINNKYIHLPNQFWEHKNHILVLKALNLLKKEKKEILIVCTGHTDDYRNKAYFNKIKKYIKEKELENNFYILGNIAYEDVAGLMRYSLAMLNPSLFEGWSTSVEEAKTIGKNIILSDLAVHKEQKADGAVYFKSNDVEDLAKVMWNMWSQEKCDKKLETSAKSNIVERRINFAESYEKIIQSILEKKE